MDNKIKSKTRLAAIQLVSQQLVNKQDIEITAILIVLKKAGITIAFIPLREY